MTQAKPKSDQSTQSQRFIDTACELGADEDEAAFRAKLRVMARQKPKKESAKPVKKRSNQ